MLCEEARRLLRGGTHQPVAESHLETCRACFEALENDDWVVTVLQAKPRLAHPSPELAPRIVQRWQPARASWQAGLAAAIALGLVAVTVLGITVWSAPGLPAGVLAASTILLSIGVAAWLALLAAPQAALLEQPVLLAGYVALTILVCTLWIGLYHQSQVRRRNLIP